MLNVCILCPREKELDRVKQLLQNTIIIEDFDAKISFCNNDIHELSKYLNQSIEHRTIYFLLHVAAADREDILNICQHIRSKSAFGEIILSFDEFLNVQELIQLHLEPMDVFFEFDDAVLSDDLRYAYSLYLNHVQMSKTHLAFHMEGKYIEVRIDEVVLLQTVPNHPGMLKLNCLNKTYVFKGLLNTYAQKYPTLFRCHKSYLINPDYIKLLDTNLRVIKLANDLQAEVSYRKLVQTERLCKIS
ncbi:LytTR family DNA-binding domain-containing protein [Furfurilactobacillus entadae]|uniref:LytTR family DNA-binding domain-containing protein n=1 Tax=Furfurilactobacillus entadae TaxID=2922307 RepID=UPI0035EFC4E1